jgi:hypothetical protein
LVRQALFNRGLLQMKKALIALIALAPLTGCGDKRPAELSYTTVTTATYHCTDGSNVLIEANDQTFTLTGTCGRILVNGSNDKVMIEAAKRVDIHGPNNKVEIVAVDALRAHSTDNTIKFKRSLTGRALDVVAIGDNNTLTQSR